MFAANATATCRPVAGRPTSATMRPENGVGDSTRAATGAPSSQRRNMRDAPACGGVRAQANVPVHRVQRFRTHAADEHAAEVDPPLAGLPPQSRRVGEVLEAVGCRPRAGERGDAPTRARPAAT